MGIWMIAAMFFGFGMLLGLIYLLFKWVLPICWLIVKGFVETLMIWGKALKQGWQEEAAKGRR